MAEFALQGERVSRFFGGLPAVREVSFVVERQAIFGLIGPNGAGKTTLLNLISGILPPSAGRVRFKGHEITRMKPHAVCRLGISRVLQTPRPFASMTVLENVAVGATFGGKHDGTEPSDRAERMLSFLGLEERRALPVGLLNLQEKKMVDLARALATGPELLLVDEAMSGLNPAEVEHAVGMIRRVRDELGVTIIWIEHVMKAVMGVAERIMVLDHGEAIAQGSPREVAGDERVIQAYLGSTSAA